MKKRFWYLKQGEFNLLKGSMDNNNNIEYCKEKSCLIEITPDGFINYWFSAKERK
jgi:hypothetical protein